MNKADELRKEICQKQCNRDGCQHGSVTCSIYKDGLESKIAEMEERIQDEIKRYKRATKEFDNIATMEIVVMLEMLLKPKPKKDNKIKTINIGV